MFISTVEILAQVETSTPTWAVLMLVLGFLISAVLLILRIMNGKVETAENRLADGRHNEVKTLIGSVGSDVQGVAHRMDKVERDVTGLKIGHAELRQQVDAASKGAGNE